MRAGLLPRTTPSPPAARFPVRGVAVLGEDGLLLLVDDRPQGGQPADDPHRRDVKVGADPGPLVDHPVGPVRYRPGR